LKLNFEGVDEIALFSVFEYYCVGGRYTTYHFGRFVLAFDPGVFSMVERILVVSYVDLGQQKESAMFKSICLFVSLVVRFVCCLIIAALVKRVIDALVVFEDRTGVVYGNKYWYLNGELHREDGPARECANGDKYWYLNGKFHREDGPAVEFANGAKYWYLNGKFHREDGPAVEYANGTKYWYLNGKQHREDGPAIEYANGDKSWYLNGKLHREDGPAIECADGYKEWWLNGKRLTKQEFLARQQDNCDGKTVEIDGKKYRLQLI
jgi:hypothetical protein